MLPLRFAITRLQSTLELRTTAPQITAICSSETGSLRQSGKTTISKHFLNRILKGTSSMQKEKIRCQSTVRNFHAAITITLAAAAARNLDTAIPLPSADTELQSAKDFRTTAPQMAGILQLQNRISTPKRKNDDFEAFFTRNFTRTIINAKNGKNLLPKHRSQISCSHITVRLATLGCETR